MKIEITTSAKNIELANFFLARAIEAIRESKNFKDTYSISETDIKGGEMFRKQLLKAYLKKK